MAATVPSLIVLVLADPLGLFALLVLLMILVLKLYNCKSHSVGVDAAESRVGEEGVLNWSVAWQ